MHLELALDFDLYSGLASLESIIDYVGCIYRSGSMS